MNSFDQILEVVGRAESLGWRTLSNGVRLVGHIPHFAPEAYLHVLFPPLEDGQISLIEQQVGRKFHADLKAFYGRSNGLTLFAYSLDFVGLRTSYVRTGDEAWQPFSIVRPTLENVQ